MIVAGLFTAGLFIFAGEFDVVYTFEPDGVISSSEVNRNFQDLAERTLGSISNVNTEGAALDKVLKYNGENWYAGNDEGGVTGNCEWDTVIGGINYAGGNVGVGSTSPDARLDVLDGSDNPQMRLTRTDGSLYADFCVDQYGNLGINPSGGVLFISNTDTNSYAAIHMWNVYQGSHELVNEFSVNGNSYITGGNVGIGTTGPTDKLSIGEKVLISDSTNPANPPAGGVVIYFDGTQLIAKNSAGATSQITNF